MKGIWAIILDTWEVQVGMDLRVQVPLGDQPRRWSALWSTQAGSGRRPRPKAEMPAIGETSDAAWMLPLALPARGQDLSRAQRGPPSCLGLAFHAKRLDSQAASKAFAGKAAAAHINLGCC